MNYKIIFLLLTLTRILTSCKPKYKIQPYSLSRNIQFCDSCDQRKVWSSSPKKSIVLVSDSTLNYTCILGHIGATTEIKYELSKDTLILSSSDIYGKKVADNFQDFSNLYLYNIDSLTSLTNEEKYYSEYNQKRKKGFEQFYFIIDNQKYKITSRRNAIRFVKKLDLKSEYGVLDKKIAKSKYGINEQYLTYVLKE